jgi:proteasome lid subunit RPN8/RPN11
VTVVIAPAGLRAIVDAAEAAYPEECCGLLVGHIGARGRVEVREVHASRNLAGDPRRAFEVDPGLRLAGSGMITRTPTSPPSRPRRTSRAPGSPIWYG